MARVSKSKHIPTRAAVMYLKCPAMSKIRVGYRPTNADEWIHSKMKQIFKVMKQTRAEVTKMEIGHDYIIVNYLH